MAYRLGVDLGTTSTVAAVLVGDSAEVVDLGTRTTAVPSVVFRGSDGQLVVGEAAERRAAVEPDRVARDVKRRLGARSPIMLGGSPYSAQALLARLLESVLESVTRRRGAPPEGVVLTHPSRWGPFHLELFDEVARLADVRHVATVSESEAALLAWASRHPVERDASVVVVDFGGGACDATLLRRSALGFDIVAVTRIPEEGGIDVDTALVRQVLTSLDYPLRDLSLQAPDVRAGLARLRRDCAEAKEVLSTDLETTVHVVLPGMRADVPVTRIQVEGLVHPIVERTVAALSESMRAKGVDAAELTTVVLTGGGSRIPSVRALIADRLGRPVDVAERPKLDVALGAAWASARLEVASGAGGESPQDHSAGLDESAAATGAVAGPTAPRTSSDADPASRQRRGAGLRGFVRTARGRVAIGAVAAVAVAALAVALVFDPDTEPKAFPVSDPLPGTRLVMVVIDAGNANIYDFDVETEDFTALVDGTREDTTPILSLDRRSVVYVQQEVAGDPSTSTLRVMAADGSDDRELFSSPDRPCDSARRPAWNPTGTLLVVQCLDGLRQTGMWVVTLDGSPVRRLPVPDNADTPTWSADGRIAYALPPAGEAPLFTDEPATATLWAVGAEDGAVPEQLTSDETVRDRGPQWSPDGSRLLFVRVREGAADVFVREADGTETQLTTVGDVGTVTWSPSGSQIAFTRRAHDGHLARVSVMNADGSDQRELLTPDLPGAVVAPAWGSR